MPTQTNTQQHVISIDEFTGPYYCPECGNEIRYLNFVCYQKEYGILTISTDDYETEGTEQEGDYSYYCPECGDEIDSNDSLIEYSYNLYLERLKEKEKEKEEEEEEEKEEEIAELSNEFLKPFETFSDDTQIVMIHSPYNVNCPRCQMPIILDPNQIKKTKKYNVYKINYEIICPFCKHIIKKQITVKKQQNK